MTRARGLLAVIALLAAQARLARAQTVVRGQAPPLGYQPTPQRFAAELRLGPYRPDIDGQVGRSPGPQEQYFGDKRRLMFQAELDYQFFQRFGTLAVGVSGGYFSESGQSFVEGGAPGERANDTTRLTIYPLAASLVYRLDVAARLWKVPLVPYGKVGLDYWIWRVTDGNGRVATSTNPSGRGAGASPGFHLSAGLSLLLDILDPSGARALDRESGVNHTYAFVEVTRVDANGLGRKNVLDVGGTAWSAGLMFEF